MAARGNRRRELITRTSRRLAGGLVNLVRPSASPEPPAPEEDPEDAERREALHALKVGMELAELMLASGASANDVTATMLRVARAYGLRGVHCDVTYTSIFVAWPRPGQAPLTAMRVIRSRSTDYTRLQRAQALVADIVAGRLNAHEAHARFRKVAYARPPYRPWVVISANGMVTAGLAMLWQATPIVLAITFITTCLIDITLTALSRRRVPAFFRQAVGAAIPTTATLLTSVAQARNVPLFDNVQPNLIVYAGVVVLLAGMSVVGAAQDSIDGYYVTATGRSFEVLVLTLGIVTGILTVITIGRWFGASFLLLPVAPTLTEPALQLVASVIIAMSFAAAAHASPRAVALCAVLGPISWIAYLGGLALYLGPIGASAVGAAITAMLANLASRWVKVPALALVSSATVILMPGTTVYRGLLLTTGATSPTDTVNGMITLFTAAGIGMALAAGSSLGTFIARPTWLRVWRRTGRTMR